jgi:hypothetical protein
MRPARTSQAPSIAEAPSISTFTVVQDLALLTATALVAALCTGTWGFRRRDADEGNPSPGPKCQRYVAGMRRIARLLLMPAVALLALAPIAIAAAPTSAWALRFAGTGNDYARSAVGLADGSTIVGGSFSNSMTLGPHTLQSAGGEDVFLARVRADGSIAWAVRGGGAGLDRGFGITHGAPGTIVYSGYFTGSATFGTMPVPGTGSSRDTFIASVNVDTGTFNWVTNPSGTGQDYVYRTRGLADGSVLAVGSYENTLTLGSTTLPQSSGNGDLFAARLNPDGTFRWARRIGGSVSWDDIFSMWLFPDGSMAAAGYITGDATFGSDALTRRGNTESDALVVKLDPNGNVQWARNGGGNSTADFGYAVSGYADGSVVVGGYFTGTGAFGPHSVTSRGGRDIFLAKYSPTGTVEWVRTGGSAAGDDEIRDLHVRADGTVLLAATISGTVGSPFEFRNLTLVSAGGTDGLAGALDADGNFTWHAQRGGSGTDDMRQTNARSDGFITTAGSYQGNVPFGPTTLIGLGASDGFAEGFTFVPDTPAPPTIVMGPGHATATIEPLEGGGVTEYEVTALPGGSACQIVPPALSCTINGLQGGTTYEFTVVATNTAGASAVSSSARGLVPQSTAAPPAAAPATAAPQALSRERLGALRGRTWRIGRRAITVGDLPAGATRVVQTATRIGGTGGTRTGARRATAGRSGGAQTQCRIEGAVWSPRYRCVRLLTPGTWQMTTEAQADGFDPSTMRARVVMRGTVVMPVTG